jgi:hypothetical protein
LSLYFVKVKSIVKNQKSKSKQSKYTIVKVTILIKTNKNVYETHTNKKLAKIKICLDQILNIKPKSQNLNLPNLPNEKFIEYFDYTVGIVAPKYRHIGHFKI